ncbi:MAG: hypothetical protein LH481_02265 [Burkholderiales bacterium]|nr:hypothetical protein [Burkholderiales bacterium]
MTERHRLSGGKVNHGSRGYVHTQVTTKDMKSYLLSVIAIFSAAIPGTFLAWWGTSSLGLSGIPQALATVFLGMVMSVAFFAGMIALGRALKFIK